MRHRSCSFLFLAPVALLASLWACSEAARGSGTQPLSWGGVKHSHAALSAEVQADTPLLGPAFAHQYQPRAAFTGNDFLVVWQDYRALDDGESQFDLFGARLSPSGTLLDPTGFPVSTAPGNQLVPSVAAGGTVSLVAWTDLRGGFNSAIYAARVANDGSLLDSSGIPVAENSSDARNPAVGWDGTNFLVVYEQATAGQGFDLYGTRVSPGGVLLDSPAFPICQAAGSQEHPQVAYQSPRYFVVWDDARSSASDVYAARVTSGGTVLDADGFLLSQNTASSAQDFPSVALSGSCTVVWHDKRRGIDEIWGTQVDFDGGITTPNGFLVADAGNLPSIATGNATYLVSWTGYADAGGWNAYSARLGFNGNVEPTLAVASGLGNEVAATPTFGANEFLLPWVIGHSPTETDTYASRISTGGGLLDPNGFLVSQSANAETNARGAFDGTRFLVVWQDFRSGGGDVLGMRFDSSGNPLDPAAFAISTGPDHQLLPDVAFVAPYFLVVWEDRRSGNPDVYGARVNGSGTVVDSTPFPVAAAAVNEMRPAVTSGGTQWFVTWTASADPYDVYGSRVSLSGAALDLDGGLPIRVAPQEQSRPATSFDGTQFLTVWHEESGPAAMGIVGRRVSSAGVVLDPSLITVSPLAGVKSYPAIAFGGSSYLVSWAEQTDGGFDLVGARVTPSGTVLDPAGIPISRAPGNQLSPSVAWDGESFRVAWQDRRGSSYDLFMAEISSSGAASPQNGGLLSGEASHEYSPHLAPGQSGELLAVYDRFDLASGLGARRVHARYLVERHLGASCAAGGECLSGLCVDGVCCDSACGGGLAGDCQACSLATGASVDGTCAPIRAGTLCRASSGPCDGAESCDGVNTACPPDGTTLAGPGCSPDACSGSSCAVSPPTLTGPLPTEATCAVPVLFPEDAGPAAAGEGPLTFTVRAGDTGEVPDGFTVDPETGRWTWTPPPKNAATYSFDYVVQGPGGETVTPVTLTVQCPGVSRFRLACGCGATTGASWIPTAFALSLGTLLRPRRKPRLGRSVRC